MLIPRIRPADLATKPAVRYSVAVALSLLALLLTWWLPPDATQVLYLFFFAAVFVSTWYGGLGPGLLSAMLGVPAIIFFLMEPGFQFYLSSANFLGLTVFLFVSVLTCALTAVRGSFEMTALTQSEQLRVTLASIGDAVIVADAQGRVTFINAVAERLSGWSQAMARGQSLNTVFEVIDEQTHQPVESPAIQAIRTGSVIGLANHRVLRARDGRECPIDDSAAPIKNEHGDLVGVVLVFRDVTERRQAEVQLQQTNQALRTLIDASPLAIMVLDQSGCVRLWNPAAERHFGWSTAEVLGQPLPTLLEGDDESASIERAIQSESIIGQEISWHRKDGERLDVDLWTAPLNDPNGGPRQVMGVVADITQRKRAEESLRFLAETSTLLASSLDYESTLASLVQLIVPGIADCCSVYVSDSDGKMRPVASAHADPAKRELLWDILRRYPPDPNDATPLSEVVRTGVTRFVPEITSAMLPGITRDAEHLEMVESLGIRSYIAVPLQARGRIFGVINTLFTDSGRRYSSADLALVESLASRCSYAVDSARLFREAQRRAAHLDVLSEASRDFAEASLDLPAVLDRVVQRIARSVGDACMTSLLSADGKWLTTHAAYHPAAEAMVHLRAMLEEGPQRVDEGLNGQVARSGRPLRFPVVTRDQLRTMFKPRYRLYVEQVGITSLLIVPLRVRGQIIGTLQLLRDASGRPYTQEDQSFLQELADRAALSIDNARLHLAGRRAREVVERSAERTTRLLSITAALAEALTPDQVAKVIISEGLVAIDADAVAIYRLHEQERMFELLRYSGYPEAQAPRETWFPVDEEGPLREAVVSGDLVVAESPEEILVRWPHLAETRARSNYAAIATAPLLLDQMVLGVLHVSFRAPHWFDPEDLTFLATLARQCAQAFERGRLYEAEQIARKQAEAAQRRMAFLAEASAVLVSSLDYEPTLDRLAHLVIPTLGDACIIDIVASETTIPQVMVAHVDPAREALLRNLRLRYPLGLRPLYADSALARAEYPELISDMTDISIEQMAEDDEHLHLLRELNFTSAIGMPLSANGRTLGMISFGICGTERRYHEDDLSLAEELARRAALAIDNARLYRDVHEAVGLRDVFLSVASHELKTPLTSLYGQAQLLERRATRDNLLQDRDLRTVQVIIEQARRLNKLIAALLDISRIQMGQLSIERAPVDLGRLAQRVVEDMRPTRPRHTITVEVPNEPLFVEGDALRLEQVLQNLIDNATKYSPHGGPVDVCVEQKDGFAYLLVSDKGIGIPEAAQPQLFQRFYRASNADHRNISGMGVGLYVVKEIISLHDGTVGVTSTEGVGSTFAVCLPLFATPQDVLPVPAEQPKIEQSAVLETEHQAIESDGNDVNTASLA